VSFDTGASGTDDPRRAAADQPGGDVRPDNQAEDAGTGDAPTERPHPGGDADVLLDESPTIRPGASSDSPPELEKNANGVYIREPEGVKHVYKPTAEENRLLFTASIRHGGLAEREVAASELAEELGIDLVPRTRMGSDDRGAGSLQIHMDSDGRRRGWPVERFSPADQEQMAVLDYVTGNLDRHRSNYLNGTDGRPVAIDHGYAFPDAPVDPIKSTFVTSKLGQPLSEDVLGPVRAAAEDRIDGRLRSLGLSDEAVDGAMTRLREIRREGVITGASWPGRIIDAEQNIVKESDQ
jgi:hypothetical protein